MRTEPAREQPVSEPDVTELQRGSHLLLLRLPTKKSFQTLQTYLVFLKA